jgi:hypothetical protein
MIAYVDLYFQPLIVLLVGVAVISFVGLMNWDGNIKEKSIKWIANEIFGGKSKSDISAENLFMHVTTIILTVGILWVGLAFGYLFDSST